MNNATTYLSSHTADLRHWFLIIGATVRWVPTILVTMIAMTLLSCSKPIVNESSGPLASGDAKNVTLCGHWPRGASEIEYSTSSVGMGGRLLAYRVSAPLNHLECHVTEEFQSHWDKPSADKREGEFKGLDLDFLEDAYGVHLDWLDISSIENGVIYDGGEPSTPTIWIDRDKQVLYFLMTD